MINVEQDIDTIMAHRNGFLLEGSEDKDTVVYFIHGIGANAAGLYPLAKFLNEENHLSSEGLCLPGHATSPEDLKTKTFHDWVDKAQYEFTRLSKIYKNVYIGGVSLGALIALYIAENNPVKGLVLVSVPLVYKRKSEYFAGFLSVFREYYTWKGTPKGMDEVRAGLVAYRQLPFKSIDQMTKLQHLVKKDLAKVKCPVLDMYGSQDALISPKSVNCLRSSIRSSLTVKIYPDSGHTILFGPDHEAAFGDISHFLPKILR
jgi:carboxylesterase